MHRQSLDKNKSLSCYVSQGLAVQTPVSYRHGELKRKHSTFTAQQVKTKAEGDSQKPGSEVCNCCSTLRTKQMLKLAHRFAHPMSHLT